MINQNLDQIFRALILSYRDQRMSDGSFLYATDDVNAKGAISDARVPGLYFNTGVIDSVEWDRWTQLVNWQPTALFKVPNSGSIDDAQASVRGAIDDLYAITMLIKGLPVDAKTGAPVPYSMQTAHAIDTGKILILLDRKGPNLKNIRVTELPGTPYAEAQVTFDLEFTSEYDPRTNRFAKVFALGLTPYDPRLQSDTWTPNARPTTADTTAIGQYNTPDPKLSTSPDGPANVLSAIPLSKAVKGADPSTLVKSVNVTPYVATVVAAGTKQMQAVVNYQDYSSFDATARVVWSSSAPSKATVNSAGLVTGVATGTANITATYGGVTSNVSVITVP